MTPSTTIIAQHAAWPASSSDCILRLVAQSFVIVMSIVAVIVVFSPSKTSEPGDRNRDEDCAPFLSFSRSLSPVCVSIS